jgi:hypothetical protein
MWVRDERYGPDGQGLVVVALREVVGSLAVRF